MKKLLSVLRSMRFGIVLLCLIAACSVVGTVIPQGYEAAWYAENYPAAHTVILLLGLDDLFKGWFFALLLGMLCFNLILCSIVRVRSVARAGKTEVSRAAALSDSVLLTPQGVAELRDALLSMGCRAEKAGDCEVFTKRSWGRWGSFLTHLSILLIVLLGAAALYLPTVTDVDCLPGESVTLSDGSVLQVYDFSIADDTGRTDYVSTLSLTLSDGRSSGRKEIRVNHPLALGTLKVYQQSYGTVGSVTVTNPANGGTDGIALTDEVFLSLDGANGVWYRALYGDYLVDPGGNITLISAVSGRYENPVYELIVAENGSYVPTLAFPGDEIEAGALVFRFNEPLVYPGLRVKHTPAALNALLIAAFVLLTLALAVTFFCEPVVVKLDADGYAVGGPKSEHMRVELGARFAAHERKEEAP